MAEAVRQRKRLSAASMTLLTRRSSSSLPYCALHGGRSRGLVLRLRGLLCSAAFHALRAPGGMQVLLRPCSRGAPCGSAGRARSRCAWRQQLVAACTCLRPRPTAPRCLSATRRSPWVKGTSWRLSHASWGALCGAWTGTRGRKRAGMERDTAPSCLPHSESPFQPTRTASSFPGAKAA